MADPIRTQIIDKVISALSAVTTITTVSESIKHWEELDKNGFPYAFPVDTDETKEPFTLQASTGADMLSTLTILVTGMVYSGTNVTRATRVRMIRNVEKALVTSAALKAITGFLWILPTRVVTDKGSIPNYSIWDQEFQIQYIYESSDGG